jgi:hypothetical protein
MLLFYVFLCVLIDWSRKPVKKHLAEILDLGCIDFGWV